jgi:cystathionine beta-lyase/cystathionine gamma-synthase
LGPFDSFLTLRGLKTLSVRMARHCENAGRISQFLAEHEKVGNVIYPGLSSHPQHALARTQMRGMGGMISFNLRGDLEGARRFLANLRIFALAESLGGVESLVEHPAIMTHASIPKATRDELGIGDTFIRLSVGIEHCDDLLADLERGFAAL